VIRLGPGWTRHGGRHPGATVLPQRAEPRYGAPMEPLPPSSFEPLALVLVGAGVLVWGANLHLDAVASWMDGVVRGVAAGLGIAL
jgi:hypothetical protein